MDSSSSEDEMLRIPHSTLVNTLIHCRTDYFYRLLKAGCDVDYQVEETGWTALMEACDKDMNECVKVLIEHNCKLDLQDNSGDTALMVAFKSYYSSQVSESFYVLLEKGCDTNIQDNIGQTVLFSAVYFGSTTAVSELLRCGCNPNIQDIFGKTALMTMINCTSETEIVSLLLNAGADPLIEDNCGCTALHFVNYEASKNLLISRMNALNSEKRLALLCARKKEKNLWENFPLDLTKYIFKSSMLWIEPVSK